MNDLSPPLLVAVAFFLLPLVASAEQEQIEFFEKKIRPVLVKHCYQCHSVEEGTPKGGLLLDSRDGMMVGGDSIRQGSFLYAARGICVLQDGCPRSGQDSCLRTAPSRSARRARPDGRGGRSGRQGDLADRPGESRSIGRNADPRRHDRRPGIFPSGRCAPGEAVQDRFAMRARFGFRFRVGSEWSDRSRDRERGMRLVRIGRRGDPEQGEDPGTDHPAHADFDPSDSRPCLDLRGHGPRFERPDEVQSFPTVILQVATARDPSLLPESAVILGRNGSLAVSRRWARGLRPTSETGRESDGSNRFRSPPERKNPSRNPQSPMNPKTRSLEIVEKNHDRTVEVHVSGRLEKKDYEYFAPEIEKLIREHGKLNLLVHLENFDGWSAGALWEDVKFDAKHFRDIERLAIIGDQDWEKGMTTFCKPFTTAEVKFFPPEEIEQARAWTEAAD